MTNTHGQQSEKLQHKAADLELIFGHLFLKDYNTRLQGGASEPLYRPVKALQAVSPQPRDAAPTTHVLFYRENFFASALHETAHWCIAGEARRKLVDFGYWYEPEGRNMHQQQAFLNAEIKPQALECLFSQAAAYPFHASIDNFNNLHDSTQLLKSFESAVKSQVDEYLKRGLPQRAYLFYTSLKKFYQGGTCLEVTKAQ